MRQVLRTATAAAHQKLHTHPVLAPLANPGLSEGSYVLALRALYGIHAAADARLAEFWPERTGFARLLAVDLESLSAGLEARGAILGSGAPIATLPLCRTNAAYLGVCYVIDGSRFGARVLASNVRQQLGFAADSGASFLNASGPYLAAGWQALLLALEALTLPDEREQAVVAANGTFAEIGRWLDRYRQV